MSNKRRLFSLVAATAVATTTVGIASLGTAHAAPGDILGNLTLTPATGNQSNAPDITTPTGVKCPAGTGSVSALMTGQTLTEDNPGVFNGSVDYNLVQGPNNNLKVPAATTLAQIFQDNAITAPSGAYRINLLCLDANSFAETGRFVIDTTWTATGGNYNGSYVTVAAPVATTTVLSGPTTSVAGGSVTLTATVSNNATGSVTFKDGSTTLGSGTVDGSGVATYTTSSLAVGAHTITADFVPTGNFVASSSNTLTHTVAKVVTTTTLSSNASSAQYAPAVFTATVSPASAGSVTFKQGANTLGTVTVTGGQAVLSTTTIAPGVYNDITATFVPANPANVLGSDSNTITHSVTAFQGASVSEHIIVEVPAGALTMIIDDTPGSAPDGTADGNVDLGTAVMDANGDKLTASGEMDPVKITDTRAGDPGWTATGIVTNFAHGTDEVNGFNLGWTPSIVGGPTVGLSTNQRAAFVLGGVVNPANEGSPSTDPANGTGLKATRTLGTAPDNSGNGTARLGAHFDLNIPTDVPAGTYGATLTLTVI